MTVEVLTKEDLQLFRMQLLKDLKELLSTGNDKRNIKTWLRSKEVRKMLSISPGTLQNLRITGSVSFTKLGNLYYYKLEDIETLLNSGGNSKT
jgi:hypothetical protein